MISTAVWSALPAHITMPSLMMSASLRGFKLAKTTQSPSVICSRGTNSCKPEPIVRSLPSPRSIFSTYSFADSGWREHSTILATRKSQAFQAASSSLNSTGASVFYGYVFGFSAFGYFSFFAAGFAASFVSSTTLAGSSIFVLIPYFEKRGVKGDSECGFPRVVSNFLII